MGAPSKGFTVIPDTDIDAESPGDVDLFTFLRDNDIHIEEWLGLSYTAAQDHDHDGVNSKAVSGASLVLVASASPSGVASVDLNSAISALYHHYLLVFDNLVPSVDDRALWLRTSSNNGVSFDSGGSNYGGTMRSRNSGGTDSGIDANNRTEMVFCDPGSGQAVGNAAGEGISGRVWISDPLNAAQETLTRFEIAYTGADNGYYATYGMWARRSAAIVDALQLRFETGNIASGEVRLFGVKPT